MNKIPFFSIIIACYNSSPYIAHLLQSIVDQHMSNDIQVILSDDCSTESYDKEIEPFLTQLNIKRISTDYNCCPGNTRQRGVENATGEWICFSDHDDEFIPDTLALVKKDILEHDYKYYVKTEFHEIMRDTGQVIQIVTPDKGLSWNHGKFYNRKNLWEKYNIHFIHNLLSHEDVAITAQINSVMVKNHLEESRVNIHTYNWLKNPESLSNRRYMWQDQTDRQRSFLECFFKDYLKSTGWIYLNYFKEELLKQQEDRDNNYICFLRDMIVSSILYGYYYSQSFLQEQGPYFIRENFAAAGQLVYQTLITLNGRVEDIENYCRMNLPFFDNIRNTALIATGPIVPTHGFKEWIELVLFMYYPTQDKRQEIVVKKIED